MAEKKFNQVDDRFAFKLRWMRSSAPQIQSWITCGTHSSNTIEAAGVDIGNGSQTGLQWV